MCRKTMLLMTMLGASNVFGQIVTNVGVDGFTVDRGEIHGVTVGMTGMIETDLQLGERLEALRFAAFVVQRIEKENCLCKVTEIQPGHALSPGQRVIFDEKLIPPQAREQTAETTTKPEPSKPRGPDLSRMSVMERIQYGRDQMNQGNYERAVEVFDDLKSDLPDDAPFRKDHARAKTLLEEQRQKARDAAARRARERAEQKRKEAELAEIRKNLDYYRVLVDTYKSSDLDKAVEYQEQICRVDSSAKARNLLDDLKYEQAKRRLPSNFESDDIQALRRTYPKRSQELVAEAERHERERVEREKREAERIAKQEAERLRREAEAEAAQKAPIVEALASTLTQKGRVSFGTGHKDELRKNDDHPVSKLADGFPMPFRRWALNTSVNGKPTQIQVNGNVVLRGSLSQPKVELQLDLGSHGKVRGIDVSALIQAQDGKDRSYLLTGNTTAIEGFELEVGGELWIREKKDEFGAGGFLALTLARDQALEEARWDAMSIAELAPLLPSGTAMSFALPNGQTIRFRWIPAGSFQMGSPSHEKHRGSDERQHRVTLSKGFWMAEMETTQALWQAVMGSNPSRYKGSNRPVEKVSWDDVQEFIGKLNGMGQGTFRLPTEAEWEYACRAGTTGPFHTGSCLSTSQANYNGNYPYSGCSKGQYREQTMDVGSFSPNAWGLYDMHGNVWEWCQDWYGSYPTGSETDPMGPSSGSYRVYRGGGWDGHARGCRSADRSRYRPDNRSNRLGFRLARSPK